MLDFINLILIMLCSLQCLHVAAQWVRCRGTGEPGVAVGGYREGRSSLGRGAPAALLLQSRAGGGGSQ